MQLTAGRSPKPRKKEYVQVDSDLWAAKVEFSQTIGWIFAMAQQLTLGLVDAAVSVSLLPLSSSLQLFPRLLSISLDSGLCTLNSCSFRS